MARAFATRLVSRDTSSSVEGMFLAQSMRVRATECLFIFFIFLLFNTIHLTIREKKNTKDK